ncbi:alpha/beta fold hydrolase [Streptosporangium soli]|nr:alpha/beta fold hydrolase [Streptosporangium sp. KLBMP 9127]
MNTQSSAVRNPWIRVHKRRPEAGVRLVCLPHAGGAASFYRDWGPSLPDWLEVLTVQYPGREDRLAEPLIDDLDTLADEVARAIEPECDRPVALFGHSMGAAVGYQVACRLAGGPARPVALYVSACSPPGRALGTAVHELDDDALADDLRGQGGTDPRVLADPDLREIVFDIVRNDYRLVETHRPRPPVRQPAPITAYGADDDPVVDAATMAGWAAATSAGFTLRRMAGGHFYLVPGRERLLSEIAADLRPIAGGS